MADFETLNSFQSSNVFAAYFGKTTNDIITITKTGRIKLHNFKPVPSDKELFDIDTEITFIQKLGPFFFLAAESGNLYLIDSDVKSYHIFYEPIRCLSVSLTAIAVSSVKGDISVFSFPSFELKKSISEELTLVAISPDGQYLAASGRSKLIKIWNLRDDSCYILDDLSSIPSQLQFLQNTLYIGFMSGQVSYFSMNNKTIYQIPSPHSTTVNIIALSHVRASMITSSFDRSLIYYNSLDNSVMSKDETLTFCAISVQFYEDGETFLICNSRSLITICKPVKSIWPYFDVGDSCPEIFEEIQTEVKTLPRPNILAENVRRFQSRLNILFHTLYLMDMRLVMLEDEVSKFTRNLEI